jgi:nitrous oxidase accessory protein NosD
MKRTLRVFSILFALALVLAFSMVATTPAAAATRSVPSVYATIQAAIDAANPGDIIEVAAGTYHEQITINKSVTVNGADGAVLEGTPTLLTPPLSPGAWTTGVKIKSGDVTFNNIDVTNFTQDGIIIGYESSTPGSLQNVHVTNCRISDIQPGNHGFGIYAGYQSEDFKRPSCAPRLTAHLNYSGLLIEGNEIVNTDCSAVVLQSITGTSGTLVVRNNNIHDCENDAIWIDCGRNLVIEDNVLENNLDGFYISSYADNYVANPSNAWTYEDPWLPHLGGPYSPQNITITGNQITGNTAYGGVYLESGYPDTIFINGNNITANGLGVTNLLAEPVDATYNWWGADDGPNGMGPGTGDAVSANVDFVPWACNPTTGGLAYLTPSAGMIDDLAPVSPPAGAPVSFPYGMFSFVVTGITGQVTLTVELPGPVPVGTKWYKYNGGAWDPLPIGDDDGDNVITVTLTDNNPIHDEDSILGQITDQGGPGEPGSVGWETYPVSKARVMLPWLALLAAILAGAGVLVVRRRRAQT